MGFANADGKVIRPTLQGGIVAQYYAGALVGAFWAGDFSDRYGRECKDIADWKARLTIDG